jgi:BirA family biotin operon repressor/biotin-[acetyl-CoA-carboxylase] ligase
MTEEPAEEWAGTPAAVLRRRWGLPSLALYRRLGSTNDVARRLADAGCEAATVVLADEQLAGRGRVGRRWSSPAGLGLWFSTISRSPEPAAALPLAVGLAVAEALDEFLPGRCGLKWPNDLVFAGRKLGGILCEGSWDASGAAAIVIGVGVNVLHEPHQVPPEVAARATSLRSSAGHPVDRLAVAGAVIPAVARLARWGAEAGSDWLERLAARDVLRGTEVEVREPATGALLAAGTAAGLAADGALRLERGGSVVEVHSGTVAPVGHRTED